MVSRRRRSAACCFARSWFRRTLSARALFATAPTVTAPPVSGQEVWAGWIPVRYAGQRAAARCRAISYSVTPAATPALRDSTADDIGIDTTWSQVSRTRRDRPLPSDPTTTTTGSVANASPGSSTSPSMSRPRTKNPAFWNVSSARVRLGTRATGTRAAAPADVFQALAETFQKAGFFVLGLD